MAFKTSSNSTSPKDTPTALAEINVTPLVDVMLVLLIIFMVAAPLLEQGIQVDLPKVEGTALSDTPSQINLTISRDREIYLDREKVTPEVLGERLERVGTARPDVALYVQADAAVPYGVVAEVLSVIRRSKIQKIGLVTEAPEDLPSRK